MQPNGRKEIGEAVVIAALTSLCGAVVEFCFYRYDQRWQAQKQQAQARRDAIAKAKKKTAKKAQRTKDAPDES